MENKIPVFAGVPQDELTNLSNDKPNSTEHDKLQSIEKEFQRTNQHTKQSDNSTSNTDNTDNTVNSDTEAKYTTPKERKNRLGKLMGGSFAVDMVDMLIPSLVVLLINYMGYALEKKDLQLSKLEKEALSPAVQDVLDEINIDFNNPWINLGVMLAIVYGTKVMDKLPTIKKKTIIKPEVKKGMTESINETMSEITKDTPETSNMGKFEIDYGKLVDDIRLSRRRGLGDAKEYLANNYGEKIKALAVKYNVPLHLIEDQLNFVWQPKKRQKPKSESDFDASKL